MTHAIRKRLAAAIAFIPALCGGAIGGDIASLNIFGFSGDGRLFAFEEFGVQDGSGFAYASRFYIETAADKFALGSPVRVTLEDETMPVEAARGQARDLAQKIAPDSAFATNPGATVGMNLPTELSANPLRMSVLPRLVLPAHEAALDVELELSARPQAKCDGGQALGFSLYQTLPDNGGRKILHADGASLPESRGCPLGYRIAAVHAAPAGGGGFRVAVIIAVERQGFEGPDIRHIAVTAVSAP